MSEKFRDESNQIIHTHIERLLEVLPDFCAEFFVGTEMRTSWLTRYNYAHDFIIFFDYLLTLRKFAGVNITTFSFEHLDEITSTDIENFLSKVTYRKVGVQTRKNGENGKARKLSAIRSLLKYFYNKDKIAHNVASKVSLPKIHDKEIVRLTQDEAVKLLDTARNGDSEPTSRKQHWEFLRDFAMVTLFLHTGMRISELVGLDVKDINLKEECLSVVRKGGAGTVLYFDDTARDALAEYIEIRKFKVGIEPLIKGDEDALFISSRCRRIGIRTVQEIIKAQAETAAPL
ncbi:MAG: tyrosine-type recombinase/integrase, partial [Christensenellaceae bacterium]|nr:tyrosine-type recombinase/integrase [Christensenellaceae bacterium]